MEPLLLLDFDRTLFRTDYCWQDFAAALAQAANKPDDTYVSSYESFLKDEGRLQMIDYNKILGQTGVAKEVIWQNLQKIAAGKDYLFDDARQLLGQRKKLEEKFELAILTFGQEQYQRLKLNLVPEIADLPQFIIQTLKTDFISSKFAGRRGVLVDDKFGQQLPDGWVEIHIDRQENYVAPVQLDDNIYRVTSLMDVEVLANVIYKGNF